MTLCFDACGLHGLKFGNEPGLGLGLLGLANPSVKMVSDITNDLKVCRVNDSMRLSFAATSCVKLLVSVRFKGSLYFFLTQNTMSTDLH